MLEYLVLMAQDLTVFHSVPLKRSPRFFEGFFADDPNSGSGWEEILLRIFLTCFSFPATSR